MKPILLLLLAALPLVKPMAQSGRNERIATFAQAWGFLKYHHPAAGAGGLNWDSVFVAGVGEMSGGQGAAALNAVLASLLDRLGPLENAPNEPAASLFLANLSDSTRWIKQSPLLSPQNRERLLAVYRSRRPEANGFIRIHNFTADLSGEQTYPEMSLPNREYRLLFLARFWNIINYFAPYRYLTGNNWHSVLVRFVPQFAAANDSASYYTALMQLAASLNDGHAQASKSFQTGIFNELAYGRFTVPFAPTIINGSVAIRKLVVDSLCRQAGLQAGDEVLAADGVPVAALIARKEKFISASNRLSAMHQLSWFVLDGNTDVVMLKVKRGARTFTTRVKRVPVGEKDWQSLINYTSVTGGFRQMGNGVLLINAAQISNANLDTLKRLIGVAQSVIFDVRNYPNSDAFYAILDPFLSEPRMINFITVAQPRRPGVFQWVASPKIGQSNLKPFAGKVLILADERTQSQGEYSCMVLQTIPGAITIGRQTAGADGIVTYIPMGGDVQISYSGYGVYYPNKRQTQRTGIRIDIPVQRTLAGIAAGRDEILDRALQYLAPGAAAK